MKPLLLVLALTGSLYCLISCSKSNSTTTVRDTTYVFDTVSIKPKVTIVGVWVGSYFINGAPTTDSFYYQFDIRADNLVYTIGSGTYGTAGYASGPWSLTGTSFSATLISMNGVTPENIQVITATYDSTSGMLTNGVWVDSVGNGGQTGTMTLARIQ
jgi:hypothetical protein